MAAHHETAMTDTLDTADEENESVAAIESARCATCNGARTGPFCAACGQRALGQRHTLRTLVVGAFRRLFNVERGLMHTVVRLTVDPGGVVRDYLAGRTVVYVHPFIYLLLTFAAFALVFRFSGGRGGGDMERVSAAAIAFFLAATSRIVFWGAGRNYAEHLILNTFLFAHAVLLVAGPLQLLSYALPQSAFIIVAIVLALAACAYIVWGYSRALRIRPVLAALGGLFALALGLGAWLLALIWIVNLARGR